MGDRPGGAVGAVLREPVIAELRAIAAQRTAEADAMRQDLVTLRRTLGAVDAVCRSCADSLEQANTPDGVLVPSLVQSVVQRLREVSDD